MRLLAPAIRGKGSHIVMSRLQSMPHHAAKLFVETLASAIANAKQKQGNSENLWIKAVEVMEGPVMKRWHAVSRGMAHPYKKRMTHIRIILSDEKKKGDT